MKYLISHFKSNALVGIFIELNISKHYLVFIRRPNFLLLLLLTVFNAFKLISCANEKGFTLRFNC